MNLSAISDKKDKFIKPITIKGEEAYKQAAAQFPNNFYIQLAARLYDMFSPKGKRGRNNSQTRQFKLAGNDLIVATNDSGQGYIACNGKRVPASGKGLDFMKNVIIALFEAEVKGEVPVNHIANRDVKKDRLDFKKAQGTFFTSIDNQVTKVDGRRSFAIKGNINQEWAVTKEQADEVESFDPSKFDFHSNDIADYYVKKGLPTVDFTGHASSLYQVVRAILDPERELDKLARDPFYKFLLDDHAGNPYYVIAYEDNLFIIKWSEQGWSMYKTIVFPKNIKY